MYCKACKGWGPSCPDTGYNADGICPSCRDQGWDEDSDGEPFNERQEQEEEAAYWRHMHAEIDKALGK